MMSMVMSAAVLKFIQQGFRMVDFVSSSKEQCEPIC